MRLTTQLHLEIKYYLGDIMQQKLRNYIATSIGASLLMIIFGLILLLFPGLTIDIIRWVVSIFLIVSGASSIIIELSKTSTGTISMFDGFVVGVLSLVLGIVIIIYPTILNLIPIILGIWFILSSAFSLRLAAGLRDTIGGGSWVFALILAVLSIITGLILIINPAGSSEGIVAFIGIMMIIYSIINITDMTVFRIYLNKISHYFDSLASAHSSKKSSTTENPKK